ncbi:ABC transporter permease MalE like protein, partial [Aduncisulcus paluster]
NKKSFYRKRLLRDLASVGADSIPIVSVISACTGIILALQSAQQLEKVGAISYVANLVGVTIIRELGPLLTAIIVTGRSGAAFTAEIATMQISEEIDALEVMGIEPVRFLVVPKMIAMLIMVPCLTLHDVLAGLVKAGGFAVAITLIGCWQGFLAREGAADVGRKTTNSVVISIFMIILLDLFFTALNFIFR